MSLPHSFLSGKGGGVVASASLYNNEIRTSNLVNLSNSMAVINGANTVTDGRGIVWTIGGSFGYGTPIRWGGVDRVDPGNNINCINRNGAQISGTVMQAQDLNPGFYTDAWTFSNGSGPGFANWYSDGKQYQAYPAINTIINNRYDTADVVLDGVSSGGDDGGTVWWVPPADAVEVMLDFGNSHSNGTCSLAIWDKVAQNVPYIIYYGKFAAVETVSWATNDDGTRTVTWDHNPNYVYFNTDHMGTISGSHYYLYR